MIGRSYGDRMQCWPSGINCQNFVLDKGTISHSFLNGSFFIIHAQLVIVDEIRRFHTLAHSI